VVALDELEARAVGVVCGRAGTTDVVDASVVVCARQRGHQVVTGDAGDLLSIDPDLAVIAPG
jgi:hypothetical protein